MPTADGNVWDNYMGKHSKVNGCGKKTTPHSKKLGSVFVVL
jgi:hypothetical protein